MLFYWVILKIALFKITSWQLKKKKKKNLHKNLKKYIQTFNVVVEYKRIILLTYIKKRW